jgi:hypothetical protein
MATIWKSRGTVGEGSTDGGTDLPLDIIDERLLRFQLFYQGENPREILPQTQHYSHIVISVTDIDGPRPGRFDRLGFYLVVGLQATDSEFLFAPFVFVPFDERAKARVADLPIDACVLHDPLTSHMTVTVQFRNEPERNNIAHSKVIQSGEENERFVDRVLDEFLAKNGIARPG